MSLHIAGMGWVTPLGSGVAPVWERLLQGEEARVETISDSISENKYPVFRVSPDALAGLPPHPRLRRASAISRFAAAAGLAALDDARSTRLRQGYGAAGNRKIDMKRTALVFAISNGGVIYTKRFYHDIVVSGADAASPLLFPETVFNAPASHLAAILGITGVSYTLVGDGAVGLLAIRMAEDLMTNRELDYCLVVGAEEADWLLCDAYRRWRLLRSAPPIEPFHRPAKGMILGEGAGAILLGREGAVKIDMTHPGEYYFGRQKASKSLQRIVTELAAPEMEIVVASANGTFIDEVERQAIGKVLPKASVYSVKPALGESVGASGPWQVIVAAQALRTGRLPPLLHASPDRVPGSPGSAVESRRALVTSCGLNQQVAGIRLSI
jgi:3-oxoacyl-(acyl-carrier-protein) synthase